MTRLQVQYTYKHHILWQPNEMIKQLLNLKWLLQNVVFVSVLHIIIGEQ